MGKIRKASLIKPQRKDRASGTSKSISGKNKTNKKSNFSKSKRQKSGEKDDASNNRFNKTRSNTQFRNKYQQDELKSHERGKYKKFSNYANEKSSNSKSGKWKAQTKSDKTKENSDIEVVASDFSTSIMNPMLLEMSESNADEELNTRKLFSMQNRKKKSAGGFQSMGLSHGVFVGVLRRGYKVPTPIQRKTIPLIMDGQDIVAMARTGSGKTAAFLIPMFEKLITHNAASGARGLILSPTRELALQTLKFTKELGKYTQLRAAVILGGDRMDDQFEAMHNNPDIIIATPGRLMHVIVEMEIKLRHIEYVVFDEADRLFEMGFKEQLHEIIHRLPESRQTLLFSATLPKMLVEFAKAGLQDPTLIRLDVDSKLSEQLQTAYVLCRGEDKPSVLIHLLQNVVTPTQQTVIFAATMHHVDFITQILDKISVQYAYIYSSMDQTARKIAIAKFTNKKCMVLVVTDIAARGIDIPMLDVVINFNFPAKSKLFVHRVGRVARAGRSGVAYSIIAPEEMPYLLDLHLFLGRSLNLVPDNDSLTAERSDTYCGRVPQTVIDEGDELMQTWTSFSHDFTKVQETANNAYKQYLKSRPLPSSESVKRVKDIDRNDVKIGIHPVFGKHKSVIEDERRDLLARMKSYKPNTTIFEINSSQKQQARPVMKSKRDIHESVISRARAKIQDRIAQDAATERSKQGTKDIDSTQQDLESTFKVVIGPKSRVKGRPLQIKDDEYYLEYQPKDFRSEIGLSLKTSFEKDASQATLDLTADSAADMRQQEKVAKWDRKKKRFVQTGGNVGKNKRVKTEGGTWIQASYKSNIYKDWLKRSKMADQEYHRDGGSDDEDETSRVEPAQHQPTSGRGVNVLGTTRHRWQNKVKKDSLIASGLQPIRTRGGKLRNVEQILKERKSKDTKIKFQKMRKKVHEKNRNKKK